MRYQLEKQEMNFVTQQPERTCVLERERRCGKGGGNFSANFGRRLLWADVGGVALLLRPLRVLLRRPKVAEIHLQRAALYLNTTHDCEQIPISLVLAAAFLRPLRVLLRRPKVAEIHLQRAARPLVRFL